MAVKVHGRWLVYAGLVLSIVSLILQIACHAAQASTSAGSSISMANVNIEGLKASMEAVFSNGTVPNDLYNTTAGAPIAQRRGLRQEYRWGQYRYCGYVFEPQGSGSCSNRTLLFEWRPAKALLDDTTQESYIQVNEFIVDSLRNENLFGTLSRFTGALLILATVATGLCIPFGVYRSTFTFLAAAFLSCVATLSLLITSAMWTSMVSYAETTNLTKTGIRVAPGQGVWILWAAFAFSLASILPYVANSMTFRRY